MDLVLGLSITSAAIRFVLVEGATGDGATLDKGTLDLDEDRVDSGLNDLVDAVLGEGPFAAVPGNRPCAIGVTWLGTATAQAAAVLDVLAAKRAHNVIAVTESDAAAELATGISDLAGLDDVAVCLVEPGSAVAALVDAREVVVDVIDRSADPADVAYWLDDLLDTRDSQPTAVYVLGSAADLDWVVRAIEATGSAVISAADADLALARGAALASARKTYDLDLHAAVTPAVVEAAPAGRRPVVTPRVAALGGVLVAAVVTFVVSVSVALTPDSTAEHQQAAKTSDQAIEAAAPAQKLPPRPKPAAPPIDIAPPLAPPALPPPPPEALPVGPVEALPALPEAPPVPDFPVAISDSQGLPAAVPDVPAYVPPAPVDVPQAPAYVPPAQVPPVEGAPPGFTPGNPAYVPPGPDGTVPPVQAPQPRLRDRIIGRLPIINRFQQPQG